MSFILIIFVFGYYGKFVYSTVNVCHKNIGYKIVRNYLLQLKTNKIFII